jgi:hypothetical protein
MHRILQWTGVAKDGDFMNGQNWTGGEAPRDHSMLILGAGMDDIRGGDTGLEGIELWLNYPSFGGTIGQDEPLTFRGVVRYGDPSMRHEVREQNYPALAQRLDAIGRTLVVFPELPDADEGEYARAVPRVLD